MLLLRTMIGKCEIWQWLLTAILLIPMTIKDIRTKRINANITIIAILFSITVRKQIMNEENIVLMLDMLPGILTLSIAYLSGEMIGIGDGLIILFLGSVLGYRLTLLTMFLSFVISGVMSLILLTIKKVTKKSEIPFVPFLSIGIVIGGLL